jgi:cell division protein FtsI (penicillin-binding protein 3)
VLAGLLVVWFAVVVVRLVQLQVLEAAELSLRADRQHQKTVTVEGSRGMIYDRRGKVLAMNLEVPSVFGVPTALDDLPRTARSLARVLRVRADEIEKKLRSDRHFVWIARQVDPEQGRRLEQLALSGIGMVMEGRRFYPNGQLLSHVLGFTGIDGQGLEGLERRYDVLLRGEKRRIVLQRDALGRTVFPKGFTEQGPLAGYSLTLTIDEVIQYIAEKELDEAVSASQAKGGVVVVMDPQTGAVLAMAITPRFDPNAVRGLSADRWRNRVITDTYEPGSTMKIFLAAAALEEQVMKPESLIDAEQGRMVVAGTVIHDHEKVGWVTFAEAIQRSSNVAAAKIAMALGEARLYRYLRAFGFGQKTEIDLPGEVPGLLKEPRDWGPRTLASLAIGQEIGITPIQLATAVSAVANGGWLMRPYVVAEVRDGYGHLVVQTQPEVRRHPITSETAQTLGAILQGVVTAGTGRRAQVSGFRVAGKTGTAQKVDPATGTYSPTKSVASFAGYVPLENPRLTIVVIIDEPQGEAWGGTVAAPVFRRVAEQVLPYLGVASQEPIKLALATHTGIQKAR